jgi:hypothetical protein
MAKKLLTTESKNAKQSKGTSYPWLRLLDLDIQKTERSSAARGRGRPPSPFPRQSVHVTLTNEELAVLDSVVASLSQGMKGNVHRGILIAFMAFRLSDQLQRIQETDLMTIDSFSKLADLLDSEKGSAKGAVKG